MRKYAIEIYILSLVVLATAILVISDWERVTTLFAGKNDPDLKVAALSYFCGEGQLAGPGCAYADASSFINRSSNKSGGEASGMAVSEALPEPNIERAPDVTLARSDVGEPVDARDGGAVAMIRGRSRSESTETAAETADKENSVLTVIAALARSIPVATETDPLAGEPNAAAAQPVTAAPSRVASSRVTPAVGELGRSEPARPVATATAAAETPPMTPAPTAGGGPVKQTAALASLDKGAAISEPGSVGYVVIGSFGAPKNANRFAAANKHLNARTIARVRKGRLMHLVVAGPVPRSRLQSLWKEVLAAGHAQAWQLREEIGATNPSNKSPSSHPG